MHYSGILVALARDEMTDCLTRIHALPDMEVHYVYPESGQAIVVNEAPTLVEQQEAFLLLQSLRGVLHVGLAYHQVEREAESAGNGDDAGAEHRERGAGQ